VEEETSKWLSTKKLKRNVVEMMWMRSEGDGGPQGHEKPKILLLKNITTKEKKLNGIFFIARQTMT